MQCPKCGKTGFVNISGKRFCSNCGAKLAGAGTPATMSDIKSSGKTLDLRANQSTSSETPTVGAKPAGQFHGSQVSGSGVLDLRPPSAAVAAPVPAVTAAAPPAPAPEPVATPTAEPAEASKITPAVIQKPISVPTAVEVPQSPEPDTTATNPLKSPMVQKFDPHPAVATPTRELPNAVATQVDSMQSQAANAPLPPTPPSPDLQKALTAAKQSNATGTMAKLGAAVAAIAIMAAVVWLQNSPKLAFHSAASKAGIDASLPTYVPSSYRQDGPIQTGDGQLTINFRSPDADSSLRISQRRTNWDSNSLRENYISTQTTNFLAVQGEGLTIYLYGDQATWVNHGVWYQIGGTAKLSREQVLKMAYGL